MSHYRSDLEHITFLLFDVLGGRQYYGATPYDGIDEETSRDLLEHAEAFAQNELAPSFLSGESASGEFRPSTHEVILPEPIADAMRSHIASDWLAMELPPEEEGPHVPPSLRWAIAELALGANPSVAMSTLVMPQVVALLRASGTETQRRLADLVIDKHWAVTMVLTEADAGSDVGLARTRALPQPDGTWHLEGVKRFITWGEHDGADNIVHLVLARPVATEGAGGPGTKGLSLFVVPSRHYDPETGEILGRNGVRATGLERKMGLHSSPTTELSFGTDAPAVGTLLGDVHEGLRQMFHIITYVRLLVGVKAAAALSSAHLNARDYAVTRVQGVPLGAPNDAGPQPIAQHPDIRRSLLTQRAYAEGARALYLYTATLIDRIEAAAAAGDTDRDASGRHRFLLPIVKTWNAENAYRVISSECLQTFGGSGYLADYPVEQYARDTKVDSIYEGATGIQAIDLLTRRIVPDDGKQLDLLLADVRDTAARLADDPAFAAEAELLAEAADAVGRMSRQAIKRATNGSIHVAGLGATPLLLAVGDVVVGWLLLRAAERAAQRLASEDADGTRDGEQLAGYEAAGRWFARQVLPVTVASARSADLLTAHPMSLHEAAL